MAKNTTLKKAKAAKYDEFYTQITDIEKELAHYKEHFEGKTVFCNCDDPEWSNFWKYFSLNFDALKIKKLLATHFEREKQSYKLMMYRDSKGVHTEIKTLSQNGDFRSPECIELLKQADIVVTNPPFSLLIDYVNQLFEYKKQFLIITNQNSLHYKEIFPLLQKNELWLGYNRVKEFVKPDGTIQKFGNVLWVTNLDIEKRHETQFLFRKFEELPYIKYENFDAIEVSKVNDIPKDYEGYMGVPDNFLFSYNPEQFEIVGLGTGNLAKEIGVTKNYRGRTDIYYIDSTGKPKCPFNRIIIKNKQVEKD